MSALGPSAQRVQAVLDAHGLGFEVKTFPDSTRSAAEAAAAIGCDVAQIAKSLIFRAKTSDRPVLVIASGVNRVDEKKVARLLGAPIGRADADFVRARTGFAIGGVPPLGHKDAPETLIDQDLMPLGEIWAAAGTPNSVFRLRPEDLPALTAGQVADVRKE